LFSSYIIQQKELLLKFRMNLYFHDISDSNFSEEQTAFSRQGGL